jgi:hypothetical protein
MKSLALISLVATTACGSSERSIESGLRIEYLLDGVLENKQAAVDDSVRVIRRRLERAPLLAFVKARGDTIVVDVAAGSHDAIANTKMLITASKTHEGVLPASLHEETVSEIYHGKLLTIGSDGRTVEIPKD